MVFEEMEGAGNSVGGRVSRWVDEFEARSLIEGVGRQLHKIPVSLRIGAGRCAWLRSGLMIRSSQRLGAGKGRTPSSEGVLSPSCYLGSLISITHCVSVSKLLLFPFINSYLF